MASLGRGEIDNKAESNIINSKKGHRIEWIDMLKGLAILCVFMGHQAGQTNGVVPRAIDVWIYSFHMPLFFFLSGVTFSISKYSNLGQFLINKVKTLLVPMAIFSIVDILFGYLYYGCVLGQPEYSVAAMIGSFGQIIIQRQPALWFLSCLFVAEIIMYFMARFLKNVIPILTVSVLLFVAGSVYLKLVGVYLPWRIQSACIAVIFLAVGYCIKDYLKNSRFNNISIWLAVPFGIIDIMLTYVNYRISKGNMVDMASGELGNPVLFLFAAFAGIGTLVIVFSKIKTIRPLRYIGENSLTFYGLGDVLTFILMILQYNVFRINGVALGNWGILIMIFYAVIIALVLWPISWFVREKIPFILGKF